MAEYIDRSAFLEKERRVYCETCKHRENSKGKVVYDIGEAPCRACGIGDVLDDLEDVPAADVRPAVRWRWIWQDAPCFGNPYGSYKCECGCLMPHKTNFCPNCGAQMR